MSCRCDQPLGGGGWGFPSHAQSLLRENESLIESDCDEQFIISLDLTQAARIHSLRFLGPNDGRAPLTVQLYINLTSTPVTLASVLPQSDSPHHGFQPFTRGRRTLSR